MAKYKLMDGTGYSYYKEGNVYDGDYTALKFGKLVKEMAAEKPKQWQLIPDTPDKLDQLIEKWENMFSQDNPAILIAREFINDLKALKQ